MDSSTEEKSTSDTTFEDDSSKIVIKTLKNYLANMIQIKNISY